MERPILCSTPEGITTTTTQSGGGVHHQPRPCSTPEGITTTTTRRVPMRPDVYGSCSTPEGITTTTTLLPTPTASDSGCAQRLKASRRRRLGQRGGAGFFVGVLNA